MSIELRQDVEASDAAEPIAVLVVEDETLVRLLACDVLEDAGFKALAVENAAKAVDILESGRRVDFVLSDIMMPGRMTGIGLAAWIRTHRPGLPVALASGGSPANLSGLGLKKDDPFFAKPISFDAVIAYIGMAVAASRTGK